MKSILVLGAGQSSPYLIRYLLEQAGQYGWLITVGDRDPGLAHQRVVGHPRGQVVPLDVNDTRMLAAQIEKADLTVNLLPPHFQTVVARDCIQHGRHMVSASYQDDATAALDADAHRQGVLILSEMGLDPGIDLMSAVSLIRRLRDQGAVVEAFRSYGSGVPAPQEELNPLRYCITWNPRNVVMAAEHGAQYLDNGKIKILPWHRIFQHSWRVEVDGVGPMEAYPNRDSLTYQDRFGLHEVRTFVRGTLRYPGWSETWLQIVRLGLPNEHVHIPELHRRTFAEIVEMFLPHGVAGTDLERRVANYLHISPTGQIMENLRWLGLFSNEAMGIQGATAADALIHLLKEKLRLPTGAKDLVILLHSLDVRYPDDGHRRETVTSTFTHYGDSATMTAMAKTVGLPAAIAAKLVLLGELPLTGCHVPTEPLIYEPVLRELEEEGLEFVEKVTPKEADDSHLDSQPAVDYGAATNCE